MPIIQVAWTRHSESYMLYGVKDFATQPGDDLWIILSTISGNGMNNGYPCVEAVEVAPGVWERTHPLY